MAAAPCDTLAADRDMEQAQADVVAAALFAALNLPWAADGQCCEEGTWLARRTM